MKNKKNILPLLEAYRPTARRIDGIVIHCSDNLPTSKITVEDIDREHRRNGWNGVGYHFVILPDGTIQTGRPLETPGAHVSGYNNHTIGICYIGGRNPEATGKDDRYADTRTPEQKEALRWLITAIKSHLPGGGSMTIKGHRDYSPDQNRNGIIERFEFVKECPCFDVMTEYADLLS